MSSNVSAKNTTPHKPDIFNGGKAASDIDTEANNPSTKSETPRFVAPTHGGVDILKLLTELEDQIENTKKGPFGTMLGFDEDRFHMTIMKIRANLPEEMKRASKLAKDQERLVEDTRSNAGKIVEDARKAALIEFERGKTEAMQLRERALSEAAQVRGATESESEQARIAAEQRAQSLLNDAQAHSAEVLAAARAQAAQLVDDSTILQQAEALAQNIHDRAEAEAAAVRRGADDYARDVLTNLEGTLGKAVTQVQRGREMLERQ